MIELERAQAHILSLVPLLQCEPVPLLSAWGRVVAEPIAVSQDLPPFDNSAMDGYAVRADDVRQAGLERPVVLRLSGRIPAGEVFTRQVESGQAVRLFTGSPLPAGADAVVMQEDTRLDPERPNQLLVLDPVKPWENVRFKGEDLKAGTPVATPGDRLTAPQLALLAATGCADVIVRRQPVVGLVATGSELREAGAGLGPGQIYESNRVTLAALARQAGAQPKLYPLVADELAGSKALFARAFAECDLVVSSGGVSVGELDLVKAAFEAIGGELEFWKVALKPGKPFVLGRREGKLLFGLPGNPVSAFVTFLLLVRPALLQFQGAREVQLPSRTGVLAEELSNEGDRRHFVRVTLDSAGQVRPSGKQASHCLNSLASANGLLDLPTKSRAHRGDTVRVLVWD